MRLALTLAEAAERMYVECAHRLERRISLLMDRLMALCSSTRDGGTTCPVRQAALLVRFNAYPLLTLAVREQVHTGAEFGDTRMVPMDLA